MRTLTYYVAVTLDGFIAGPDGQFDFFGFEEPLREVVLAEYPETMPVHARGALGIANAANQQFDTVVMGRGTYQPALDAGLTSPYPHLEQHVVSTTVPAADGVHVSADPVALVEDLKARAGLGIWLAGGGRLAAALLPQIDRLVLKRNALLLGAGVPLVAGGFAPTTFVRSGSRRLDDTVTIETYERA